MLITSYTKTRLLHSKCEVSENAKSERECTVFQQHVYYLPIFRLDVKILTHIIKAGPLRLKQLTNTLKIRILSETSILYLIRYASIILTVGLCLWRRMPTSSHCWKKNSGVQRARSSFVEHSRSSFRRSTICAIVPIRSTGFNLAK